MTLVPSTATSAVYHDALSTARSFRTLCFLVLLLALVLQLTLFFVARYTEYMPVEGVHARDVEVAVDANGQGERRELRAESETIAQTTYLVLYFTMWAGIVFSILLSLTLAFIVLVMLNGRTIGVARETKAFLWSLVLIMLFMPWQTILNHPALAGGMFHLPGVLYWWPELEARARFDGREDWLGWVRFVVWPVVALLLLIVVWGGSGRGVREALGEDLPETDEPTDRPVS